MEKKLGGGIFSVNVENLFIRTSVGALFFCVHTQRCLFLMRSVKQRNTWGLVGGKQEANESVLDSLHREFTEELGFVPDYNRLIPIETFTSDDRKFKYVTFVCLIEKEFIPVLNHEHHGYCWIKIDHWPQPLHPGLWNTVKFQEIKDKIQTVADIFTIELH